jgi:hypothetical protein
MKHLGFMAALAAAVAVTTPAYVSHGGVVGNGATASTAVTLNFPASGVLANDIAILALHGDNHSAMAVPGDWTPCGAQEDTTGTVSARLWWKRCAGTENGTTVACTRGTGAAAEWFGGVISIFRNCPVTGTPFEGYATAQGSTTTMNGPAITTTGDKRLAAVFWAQGDDGVSTPPAGYTECYDLIEQSGNDGCATLDTQAVPTPATIAAVTRTIAVAAPSVGFGLAFLPGPAGTPPAFGPITRTHLGQTGVTAASVGVSVTAAAGSLLVVTASVRRNTAAASVIACTDNAGVGNAYTDIVTQGANLATNGYRLAKFKCRLVAGGTFTITATSASATSMGISVEQYVDASDDLSNVSPMVYNAAGDPVNTLPSAPSASNIVEGGMVVSGSGLTNPSGYTNIVTQAHAGATLQTCFNNTTSATGSWTSSNADGIACLLEVKQAV